MNKCSNCGYKGMSHTLYSNFLDKKYELCYGCYDEIYTMFKSYGDTVGKTFLTGRYERKLNAQFFGLELEFDNCELNNTEKGFLVFDANNNLFSKNKVIEAKYDGSLCNGMEVTFQPCTYKWLVQNMNNISKLIKYCCSNSTNNNAGFHIHVNKESVTEDTIYKILEFLNKERYNILDFFDREEEDSNEWAIIPDSPNSYDFDNHYQVIRKTSLGTWEFRLPKGITSVRDFINKFIGYYTLIKNIDSINNYNDFLGYFNINKDKFKLDINTFEEVKKTKIA